MLEQIKNLINWKPNKVKILKQIKKKKQQIDSLKEDIFKMGKYIMQDGKLKLNDEVENKMSEKIMGEVKNNKVQEQDVQQPPVEQPVEQPQVEQSESLMEKLDNIKKNDIKDTLSKQNPTQPVNKELPEQFPQTTNPVEQPVQEAPIEQKKIEIVFTNSEQLDVFFETQESLIEYFNNLNTEIAGDNLIEINGKYYNPTSIWYIQ